MTADLWEQECALIAATPHDLRIHAAEHLLAVAYELAGVCCSTCQGRGRRVYNSSSTWRGGSGGQTLTTDVCNRCWGTGRTDITGPNLRK